MPNNQTQRDSFEGMLEYGRSTIRSLFLLNGGAIIALLAFLGGVLAKSPDVEAALLVPAFAAFTTGLVLAVLAYFCGFLNFQAGYHEKRNRLYWTHIFAVMSGLLSLLAFIVGVFFASRFILSI